MLQTTKKPLRMRSACTQCHAAKVRCSGEKSGCTRCRRSGLQCNYLISMVGRATKRPRTSIEQTSKCDDNESPRIPPVNENSTPPQPHLGQGDPFLPLHLDLLSETRNPFSPQDNPTIPDIDNYDLNMFASYDNLALSSNNPNDAPWPYHSTGLSNHNIEPDFSNSDLINTLPHMNQTLTDGIGGTSDRLDRHQAEASPMPSLISHESSTSSVRSQLSQTSQSRIPEYYRDESVIAHYPQVTALMNIIGRLESYIQQTNTPLDQILKGNRMAIEQVKETMATTEFKSCQSCPTLVATIMDLIVGLYGLVAKSLDHPSGPSRPQTGEDGGLPDLPSQDPTGQNSQQPMPGFGDTTLSNSRSGSPSDGSKEIPLVQFGCLEVDPETQLSFRKQILKEELRRCQQAVEFCKDELQKRHVGPNQAKDQDDKRSSGFSSSRNRLQLQWYSDMEQQVSHLLDKLRCEYHPPGS